MLPTTILEFVNVFFAGILAGIEFMIHYGLHAPSEALDEESQIKLRQALVLRLRVLVPSFFVPVALSGIAVTVLAGTTVGFVFRCAGVLAMLTWEPGAPAKNWKEQVSQSERFHIVGT